MRRQYAPLLALATAASAHAQVFVGEEYERRVQYAWTSEVLPDDDSQLIESFDPGVFDEALEDFVQGLPGYSLQVCAIQDSLIDDEVFWASGESGFIFCSGTDLGAQLDLTASSSALFLFELDFDAPDDPFRLTGTLDDSGGWNVDLTVVNNDTGEVVFETHEAGDVDEIFELEHTNFYTIEVASSGAFKIDDPDSVDDCFFPSSSFEIHLEQLTCEADVNGDGALDVLDFVAFQALWQAQDPAADCDANGAFDILDFVCFQALFVAGCP